MQVSDAKSEVKSEWDALDQTQDGGKAQYTSVCDVWKDSVHRVITKTEYQTPIYIQAYTQMHSEFLRSIDSLFGTCYIWQKRYFDKIGIDDRVINAYGEMCHRATENIMDWMDAYASYKKFQANTVVEYMKTGNNYLHWWMDMCGKTMVFWNP